ncbi:MAG: hypothetical protein HY393_02940, partial [Candidatus Diapherotrites archaeon]|nr:hypothetical protein [Candidatus Diapherotrites archaeon]
MNAPKHNMFETAKERHAKLFERAVREGKADSAMISLCKWLNAQKDYFTTSSCSGRIALMDLN